MTWSRPRWTPGARGYYSSACLGLLVLVLTYRASDGNRPVLLAVVLGAAVLSYRLLRYPPHRHSVWLRERQERSRDRRRQVSPVTGHRD